MAARLISLHASRSFHSLSLINKSSHGHHHTHHHQVQARASGHLRLPPPHLKCSELASPSPSPGGRNLGSRNLLPRRFPCRAGRRERSDGREGGARAGAGAEEKESVQSVVLYAMAGVYILWLFILPYAPGDPVWAIKPDTIQMLLDLSLNFLYILPFTNLLGFHFLESPVVHPTAEALFNFVIGWTLMFAPLLFTDRRSNRFKGSLVSLWTVQMFLTNTVLIPYMAIRLSRMESEKALPKEVSVIEETLASEGGSKILSVVGVVVGLASIWWFCLGRLNESFGSFSDRWTFFLEYLASDRLGYAFIWDICLYTLFQPWLIGDNLSNVDKENVGITKALRYIPYVGLIAYLWTLARNPNKMQGS